MPRWSRLSRPSGVDLGVMRMSCPEEDMTSLHLASTLPPTPHRDSHRTSDEAQLHRQLLEAKDSASRAEERAARALRAKTVYKGQVNCGGRVKASVWVAAHLLLDRCQWPCQSAQVFLPN